MKNKLFRRILVLTLAAAMVCCLGIMVSADPPTGSEDWEDNGVPYSAVVLNYQTITEREIPIYDSSVTLLKGGTHTFGNCFYEVEFEGDTWNENSDYCGYLDTAGAEVLIYRTFSGDIYFEDPVSITNPAFETTYCAMTYGYGYAGYYYVIEMSGSEFFFPEMSEFSFAPIGCYDVITSIVDTRFLT